MKKQKKQFKTKESLFAAAKSSSWNDIKVLVCSKIPDLQVLPPLPKNLRVLECKNNPNLDLSKVSFPETLEQLFCCGRQHGERKLGTLPKSLRILYLCRTATEELPELPEGLEQLFCNLCKLTELPQLPSSLRFLRAEENRLSVLPDLPEKLEELYVSRNQLKSLPQLPKMLRHLYATHNTINTLPDLPEGLEELYVDHNRLTELPKLPSSLRELYCPNNKISFMPVLPKGIEEIEANYNPGMDWGNKIPTPRYYKSRLAS